jgi:hypothetical protein
MWNLVKVSVPVGGAAFLGCAVAAAVTDGRSLPVRVFVGVVLSTAAVIGAHKIGLVSLGAAAKAA